MRYYSPSKKDYVEITNPYDDINPKAVDILAAISPAQKKLRELDQWEILLEKQLKDKVINKSKYTATLDYLAISRERACIALDKELGCHITAAQKRKAAKELQASEDLAMKLLTQSQEKTLAEIKELCWWCAAVIGLVIACLYPWTSLLFVSAFIYGVNKHFSN